MEIKVPLWKHTVTRCKYMDCCVCVLDDMRCQAKDCDRYELETITEVLTVKLIRKAG